MATRASDATATAATGEVQQWGEGLEAEVQNREMKARTIVEGEMEVLDRL